MNNTNYRYQITVSAEVNALISQAARAARLSQSRYATALFSALAVPRIGRVVFVSDSEATDAMGRLTGNITLSDPSQKPQIKTGSDIKNPGEPDPVDSLKNRSSCRVIYRFLCGLSHGCEICIKQTEISTKTGINTSAVSTCIKELVRVGLIFYGRGFDGDKHGLKYTAPYRTGGGETALDDAGDAAKEPPENFIRNAARLPESDLRARKCDAQTIWTYQCLCTLSDGLRIDITLDDLAQKSGIKLSSLRQRISRLKQCGLIYYSNRPLDKPCVFVAPFKRQEGGE